MNADQLDRAAALVHAALDLEFDRVVATVFRDGEALAQIERDLAEVLAALDHMEVRPPLRAVATQYGVSVGEYAILIVALMPLLAPDRFRLLAPDAGDSPARATDALRLVDTVMGDQGTRFADEAAFVRALEATALVRERLVVLTPGEDGDTLLLPHPAVLELLGADG